MFLLLSLGRDVFAVVVGWVLLLVLHPFVYVSGV